MSAPPHPPGEPPVQSRTRIVKAADARSLLAAHPGPRVAWNEHGTAFAAAGSVGVLKGHGPERFHIVRRQAESLFSRLEHTPEGEVPAGVGPRLVGGGAFRPRHTAEGMWGGFDAARFWLPARQVTWVQGQAYETVNELEGHEAPPPAAGAPYTRRPAEPRTTWTGRAARAMRSMERIGLEKVVLGRTVQAPPADPVATLLRLAAREPGTTRFLIEPEGGSALVGATPERLVRIQGGRLDTHALAGSAPRGGDPAADDRLAKALAAGSKERTEHDLVVQHVESRLRTAGLEGVQRGRRRIVRLRTVQHLETPFQAEAAGHHVLDLVSLLHPTPATAGAPVDAALKLLDALEPFERGWYAGPVGWFDAEGQGEFAVALRCGLLRGDGAWLFAGAGLVAGSDPVKEWDETESKLEPMRSALAAGARA